MTNQVKFETLVPHLLDDLEKETDVEKKKYIVGLYFSQIADAVQQQSEYEMWAVMSEAQDPIREPLPKDFTHASKK